MKLKPIPQSTVVHTPTEAEAKELLAILHENGYKWWQGDSLEFSNSGWCRNKTNTAYEISCEKIVFYKRPYDTFKMCDCTILTLAEFKERYCEEEKPQPKFKVGDKVKIVNTPNPMMRNEIGIIEEHSAKNSPLYKVKWAEDSSTFIEDVFLEPYTEPETKPTEDMEAKGKEQGETGNNPQNSQLNLCELLKGHKTEYFYSPLYGRMSYTSERDGQLYFESLQGKVITLLPNGHSQFTVEGYCGIYPSRALYEQYPLDAAKAWSVWQEEQKKYVLQFNYRTFTKREINSDTQYPSESAAFRTLADRDQCISEIKAIIEKYNK